jgi:tetratricopeptide (TPR) repeat protein
MPPRRLRARWRNAEAAREIAEQAGQEAVGGYALAMQALADAHRGREQDAREAAARALELGRTTELTPVTQFARAALGLLELSLGRPAEAAEHLAPLVELARTERICEPGLTRYVPDQVEVLVELGRLDEACELLDWYEGNAVRLGRRGATASSRRCRGLLAAAQGALDEALVHFESALAEHDLVPLPFDRARTLLLYGAALRRSKRKADARDRLEEAVASFDELGAAAFAERARAELARIGGRRRSEGGLTATERQVAELVAEGRSNKEVAAALRDGEDGRGEPSRVYASSASASRRPCTAPRTAWPAPNRRGFSNFIRLRAAVASGHVTPVAEERSPPCISGLLIVSDHYRLRFSLAILVQVASAKPTRSLRPRI